MRSQRYSIARKARLQLEKPYARDICALSSGRGGHRSTVKDATTPACRPSGSAAAWPPPKSGPSPSPRRHDIPVTMAEMTGAELLRLPSIEAGRFADIAGRLPSGRPAATVLKPTPPLRPLVRRQTGSVRMRNRCWPGSAPRLPATGTNWGLTGGPGPSIQSGTPTRAATNSPSSAGSPTRLTPQRLPGPAQGRRLQP
jgi:hypothetical protein